MKKVIVCGSGIKSIAHLTKETISCIRHADMTIYLANEPVIENWIQTNSNNHISLEDTYFSHSDRAESYKAMTKKIIETANTFESTCVVFYGHPCIFAQSALAACHELYKSKTHKIEILPSISALDCLYSDLKINPASHGCQSYEATDFLLYDRSLDTEAHLILWQFGLLGMTKHDRSKSKIRLYQLMKKKLLSLYNKHHKIIIYEATQYPTFEPQISEYTISDIHANMPLNKLSTVYIPPLTGDRKIANAEVLSLLD